MSTYRELFLGSTSQKEVKLVSIISKAKAEAATMRAWKGLSRARSRHNSKQYDKNSIREDKYLVKHRSDLPWTKASANIHMSKRFKMAQQGISRG